MDTRIILVYKNLVLRHGITAEDILEDPIYRAEFLNDVRRELGADLPERELLHRLSYLRKASKLPRSRDLLAAIATASVSGQERP